MAAKKLFIFQNGTAGEINTILSDEKKNTSRQTTIVKPAYAEHSCSVQHTGSLMHHLTLFQEVSLSLELNRHHFVAEAC